MQTAVDSWPSVGETSRPRPGSRHPVRIPVTVTGIAFFDRVHNPPQEGVAPNRRTSLVVDPPDGKIPTLTPEAAKARDAARKRGPNQDYADPNAPVKADVAEDLNLGERCISFGGPPILPGAYNSNFKIVQGAGGVVDSTLNALASKNAK